MLELQEKLELFQKKLNGALLAADVWNVHSLMPIIEGINSKPDAVAFLGGLYNTMKERWKDVDFPGVPHQQIVETNDVVVIIREYDEETHIGILVDKSKAPLGLIFAHLASVFGT